MYIRLILAIHMFLILAGRLTKKMRKLTFHKVILKSTSLSNLYIKKKKITDTKVEVKLIAGRVQLSIKLEKLLTKNLVSVQGISDSNTYPIQIFGAGRERLGDANKVD